VPQLRGHATTLSRIFDWTITPAGPAAFITDARNSAATSRNSATSPSIYAIVYVQVPDVEAHIAKAEALGCKKTRRAIAIPTGTFAWIADPEGNTVGLWKPAA